MKKLIQNNSRRAEVLNKLKLKIYINNPFFAEGIEAVTPQPEHPCNGAKCEE